MEIGISISSHVTDTVSAKIGPLRKFSRDELSYDVRDYIGEVLWNRIYIDINIKLKRNGNR